MKKLIMGVALLVLLFGCSKEEDNPTSSSPPPQSNGITAYGTIRVSSYEGMIGDRVHMRNSGFRADALSTQVFISAGMDAGHPWQQTTRHQTISNGLVQIHDPYRDYLGYDWKVVQVFP